IIHRGRAGMVCETFDRDVPPVDTDDAFNDSDIYLLAIENSALFDVQLEIRRDLPFATSNFSELRRISTDELNSIANRLPAATHKVELFLCQLAVHRATADQSAFLVLKDHDFKRMTYRHIVFSKRLCDFKRAQRTDDAIVVSAFRNAIDV